MSGGKKGARLRSRRGSNVLLSIYLMRRAVQVGHAADAQHTQEKARNQENTETSEREGGRRVGGGKAGCGGGAGGAGEGGAKGAGALDSKKNKERLSKIKVVIFCFKKFSGGGDKQKSNATKQINPGICFKSLFRKNDKTNGAGQPGRWTDPVF